MKAIHRRVMQDVIDRGELINVVEMRAGILLFTAALVELAGEGVLVSVEVVRPVKKMHRAGYGDITDTYCMLSYEEETVASMQAVRGRVHLAAA